MCVTSTLFGSESACNAKPWFCDVISTRPVCRVEHRLIRAAMAELQLVRLAAERQAEQLMAETDAEDRLLAEQAANRVDRVVERLGIAGAVREEHAVGLWLRTSSAVAVPGTTVTRQPSCRRCRGMFHFMP